MTRHLLVADIGGTKTLLQLLAVDEDAPRVLREARYESAGFKDLDSLVHTFFGAGERPATIDAACMAVAGPIVQTPDGQRSTVTNLPWVLDSQALAASCGIRRARLINDFEAVAYGIEVLCPADLVVLQPGRPRPDSPRLVVGAGTGLGVAQLIHCAGQPVVLPSEGGHTDFAPVNEQQISLLRHMMTQLDHVSVERLLSGPGLLAIYEFLRSTAQGPELVTLQELTAQEDPAAAVSIHAARDRDSVAAQAMAVFVDIYGAQVGNLALLSLPYGGIFLAGGIAAKILDEMRDGRFTTAMMGKGRMTRLLTEMPVAVVTNPNVGLLGAARRAQIDICT
jgi:glucokinase